MKPTATGARPLASGAMRVAGWRVLLPAAAALAALVPTPPHFVERVYSAGFYPWIQPAVTGATNHLPFSLLDVCLAAGAAWAGWRLVVRLRAREATRLRRVATLLVDVAAGAAVVYLAFLLLWGFHYRREPADVRFRVEPQLVTGERLERLVEHATASVNRLYPVSRAAVQEPSASEDLRQAFARVSEELDMGWRPVAGRPKASLVARLLPLGGVDGMMNPWGLDVVVNPEVLPFERPFIVAHEWAHLAGHAHESDASFVGWLTCLEAGEPAQYSGWLTLFIHASRSLPAAQWQAAMERLDEGPRGDLDAVRARLRRASPAVRKAAWQAYDRYLRANRVESGIANYDEVVRLTLGSKLAARHLDPPG